MYVTDAFHTQCDYGPIYVLTSTSIYGPRGLVDPFWAYKHIEYCVENGVVQGYDDGLYRPDRDVTRDQMAVYIVRAFELAM